MHNTQTARRILQEAGIVISAQVNDIIDEMQYCSHKKMLNLVALTDKELGILPGRLVAEVRTIAEQHGLEVGPDEMALQLGLQCKLPSHNEWRPVVMGSFIDETGDDLVLYVSDKKERRVLSFGYGVEHPVFWEPRMYRWIFVQP